MSKNSSEVYQEIVNGWIRMFMYVQEVAKEIGEEKAFKLLNDFQARADKKWFAENKPKLDFSNGPLMNAYRMVFESLLGLKISDINIVEQSEDRIVHHYDLPCPILDACQKLGLDTRKYCKALHQDSLNVLIQNIDPRLRFERDYQKIRPHAHHCIEKFWIEE